MKFAVAVVSPPGYAHSAAFAEVAEGLHHTLRTLGHDSVLTDRLDLADRRTIVLGSNLLDRFGIQPPRDCILYNLEQVDDDSTWMTNSLLELFRRHPVWDYSQLNIDQLVAKGLPRPTHVPIGYVPELSRITPEAEDIDVLFYGSTNERRFAVLQELRARGFRVESIFGVYGAARDAWIARAKIIINIHYFEAKVSYLLANKRAVVSERGADLTQERELESGVGFADYDQLADRCTELLGDERARRELAEQGHRMFSARSQAEILRPILTADIS